MRIRVDRCRPADLPPAHHDMKPTSRTCTRSALRPPRRPAGGEDGAAAWRQGPSRWRSSPSWRVPRDAPDGFDAGPAARFPQIGPGSWRGRARFSRDARRRRREEGREGARQARPVGGGGRARARGRRRGGRAGAGRGRDPRQLRPAALQDQAQGAVPGRGDAVRSRRGLRARSEEGRAHRARQLLHARAAGHAGEPHASARARDARAWRARTRRCACA